ncbi:hypothetical protein BALOs_1201 [Halobacteriovorax sp. BALOs_7]|uniref:hypothetical protein n=1 Tax=Halobacteriovorax sp. BALOs_7 TaxID=2109558 RepID=UPI000EA374E4|nr:hypothetical protein [Halobacteriovorax sp. BALOs_7]AYF44208.1 hypothetical protein BALOs_1201 [Halobacteriovorax sp. BALOs_7]
MIKSFINTVVLASICGAVFLTSSDIETTIMQEIGQGTNPYKHVDRSPDFVKRTIASISDDVNTRALKKRRVEDMHIYKSYEESLSHLKSCLRTICDEYFKSDEVSENYDRYEQLVASKISDKVNKLYSFTLKRGFRSHSIVTTALDLIDIPHDELKKNSVLLLSTQKSDIRSLNAIVKLAKKSQNRELTNLLIHELDRYSKSESFKHKVSDQIISEIQASPASSDSILATQMSRFITKENYLKFGELLTKIPTESKVYSSIIGQIEKIESTNL